MADNRENEGKDGEPVGAAGGEGRWTADNKQHNTYKKLRARHVHYTCSRFLLTTIRKSIYV